MNTTQSKIQSPLHDYFQFVLQHLEEVTDPKSLAQVKDLIPLVQEIYKIHGTFINACGVGLYQNHHFLNHSCFPNAMNGVPTEMKDKMRIINAKATVWATVPIPKGQEICISYINQSIPVVERRKELKDSFQFDCECSRCLEELKDKR